VVPQEVVVVLPTTPEQGAALRGEQLQKLMKSMSVGVNAKLKQALVTVPVFAAFATTPPEQQPPLDLPSAAADASALTSYTAPWNWEDAKNSLKRTGMYEASCNLLQTRVGRRCMCPHWARKEIHH